MKVLSVRALPPQPVRKDVTRDGTRFLKAGVLKFIEDAFLASLSIRLGWKNHGASSFDYYLFSDDTCVGNALFLDFDPNNACPEIHALLKPGVTLVNPHVWLHPSVQKLGIVTYIYKQVLSKPLCLVATEQTAMGQKLWNSLQASNTYKSLHFDVTDNTIVDTEQEWTWRLLCRKALLK